MVEFAGKKSPDLAFSNVDRYDSSINVKLFIFLLWLVIHYLYIISYTIHHGGTDIKFCSYFSGVSCRQSFLAVMLAVIMFS